MLQTPSTPTSTIDYPGALYRQKIRAAEDPLICLFGFLIPLSISLSSIAAGLITLAWLTDGKLLERFREIRRNRVAHAFLAYFALYVVGLLWTQDMPNGVHMVSKQWKFLFFPVLLTMMVREHRDRYMLAFLLGMAIMHVISFLKLAGFSQLPMMHHTSYGVLLLMAIYLCLYYILFSTTRHTYKALLFILFISMTINLFTNISRTGHLAYFIVIGTIIFQHYKNSKLKPIIIITILIPILFISLYYFSPTFNTRSNKLITDISNYKPFEQSNTGNDRLTFYLNALELIRQNLFFGIGTGDYFIEYKKINDLNSSNVEIPLHLHNTYIEILTIFGIFGLVIFLNVFFSQFYYRKYIDSNSKKLSTILILLYLFIFNFDSFFWVFPTIAMFIYFSAFIYKPYNVISENLKTV